MVDFAIQRSTSADRQCELVPGSRLSSLEQIVLSFGA